MAKKLGRPGFSVKYGQYTIQLASLHCIGKKEPLGTEEKQLFVRETWTVDGWLIAQPALARGAQPNGPAEFSRLLDDARASLWVPGQTLLVTMGGVVVLNHSKGDDFEGGPTPLQVEVRGITGGRAARVTFQVELARSATLTASPDEWSEYSFVEMISVDERFLQTREVSGVLRRPLGRSTGNDPAQMEIMFPRIRGFKRTRKWQFSRNQSQLDFKLTDDELYMCFPKPITNGAAKFKAETKQTGKAEWTDSMSFSAWYEAAKGVNVVALRTMLLRLAQSRMFNVRMTDQKYYYATTQESFTEDVFTGRISMELTMERDQSGRMADRYAPTTGGHYDVLARPIIIPTVSQPERIGIAVPGLDGDVIDYGPYGSSRLKAVAPGGGGRVGSAGAGGGGVNVGAGDAPPAPPPGQPCIEMQIQRSYRTRRHLAVLKPKVKGASDIVQETAMPTMTVVEVGYARFIGGLPDKFPAELPGELEIDDIRPGVPVPDAAGKMICPVSWYRRSIWPEGDDAPSQAQAWVG